jgi:hypothetical protein
MKAIYDVQPYERDRFVLLGSPDPIPVVLYSRSGDIERVDCAQNVGFKLAAHANEAGTIGVSVCSDQLPRLRALAASSGPGFDAMLATLLKGAPSGGDAALRRMGVYRERSPLPGGGEQHYLALIAVGHGIGIIPTVVLLTDTQAVVVQAEVMKLCEDGQNPLPLCADTKGTLSAIGQRLLK